MPGQPLPAMAAEPVAAQGALVDAAFVLPEERRPKVRHTEWAAADQVPVVDLAALSAGDEQAAQKVIAAIGEACEEYGFFQVVNHGVPLDLLSRVEENARQFFALPKGEKYKVRRDFRNSYGYYDGELTKNVRDWKEIFDFTRRSHPELPDDDPLNQTVDGWNQFPTEPEDFRPALEEWYIAVEALAFRLLAAISQSLGLPPTYFHEYFKDHSTQMRLNNYPKCPDPSVTLGVSHHKDSGALTVLVQDEVGGLQVQRKDGSWVGVQPRRDAFVINVGNIFQVWSNDRYQSVEHRVVVNENKARMSVPFFFSPSYDTYYAPVPALLNEKQPPRYRAINWGEFSRKRNEGNFADYGEEIQIHHYAIKGVNSSS